MKKRYITNAVHEKVPAWLQRLIWYMWEVMEVSEKSCFQVFTLSRSDGKQQVEHSQEQPPYYKAVETDAHGEAVCGKVLLVEEHDSATMLFVSE